MLSPLTPFIRYVAFDVFLIFAAYSSTVTVMPLISLLPLRYFADIMMPPPRCCKSAMFMPIDDVTARAPAFRWF